MILPLLTSLFLPLCLAASTSSPYEQLIALASSNNGVIKLNSQTWELLTSPQRNYSAVVHLTALNKNMKCAPCREFDPTFNTVAKAWASVPKTERNKVLFGTLDFQDGQDVFKKLNIMTAPLVSFYPATEGPLRPSNGKTDPVNYDINNFGSDAVDLANHLSNLTPIPIPYKAPFDWAFLATAVSTFLVLALAARIILPVLTSRWTWAIITIGISLVMTSGFMFVRIRGMPYRTAETTMMAGFQNQVGAEIWTVAFTYGTLAFSFLALTVLVPLQTSEYRQRVGIYMFSAVILFLFSLLLQYFRVKNGGYPFRLFL